MLRPGRELPHAPPGLASQRRGFSLMVNLMVKLFGEVEDDRGAGEARGEVRPDLQSGVRFELPSFLKLPST